MRAVLKKASWGTRRIFRGIRCKKQAFPVRKRYSVPKTAFCGTRRIFKGPQNNRLHRLWTASCGTRRVFRGPQNSLLWYATHLQRCAKQPPAPPNAFSKAQKRHPATLNASSKACRAKSSTCRPGRIFSARNGPRSEVSRHKKRVTSKSIKTF